MLNGDYSSPTLPNPITTGVHICAVEEDSRSLLKPNATGRQICGVEEQLTVCKTHPSSAVFVVQMASICTSSHTQAKNKGISVEISGSVEETQKQLNHKASWDSDLIRIFLQLIANEITKGNRPFLVLSQVGYKSLAKKFEKKPRRKHGLKQLKNKYMSLKK